MNNKPIYVTFGDRKIENEFEILKEGKFENKQLYNFIDRAIKDLKLRKFGITNLWKYDMPNAWRLIYTIQTNEVMILNVILEWFNHKEYERRFKY